MSAPESLPINAPRPWVAWAYLALAVVGAILPWIANLEFIHQHGNAFDLGLFVRLANANPAAQSLSRDLLIGSSAVLLWMVLEARRLGMKGLGLALLCTVTIAFACGAPLFLFLRERRLQELSRLSASPSPSAPPHQS